MTARSRKVQQCVVSINFEQFVLPKTDALKLVDLMSKATQVDRDFHDYTDAVTKFYVLDAPKVELELLTDNQLQLKTKTPKE